MRDDPLSRVRGTHQDLPERQSGFTLIELMVAMGIFTILVSILLISVSQIVRGTVQVQVTARSTSEVLLVFQNLDRQIRYSDAINEPGAGTSGDRYVEFRVPASSSADGATKCVQWRFQPTEGTIQTRTWTDGSAVEPSGWSTKLENAIDTGGAEYPFDRDLTAPQHQLLLTIDTGITGVEGGTAISTKFVARNSSSAVSASVCGRPDSRP